MKPAFSDTGTRGEIIVISKYRHVLLRRGAEQARLFLEESSSSGLCTIGNRSVLSCVTEKKKVKKYI